jgi:hypothetical protein
VKQHVLDQISLLGLLVFSLYCSGNETPWVLHRAETLHTFLVAVNGAKWSCSFPLVMIYDDSESCFDSESNAIFVFFVNPLP